MKKSFLTEQELALGCVRKDRDAQGELYARYSSRLYAICLRYIEDREEARDLMHDCMIKAMDNFKTFRYVSEGSLYAWLSRITVNMAINRLKESSRFRQILSENCRECRLTVPEMLPLTARAFQGYWLTARSFLQEILQKTLLSSQPK